MQGGCLLYAAVGSRIVEAETSRSGPSNARRIVPDAIYGLSVGFRLVWVGLVQPWQSTRGDAGITFLFYDLEFCLGFAGEVFYEHLRAL